MIWLTWVIIIIGFQTFVDSRMEPKKPDYALSWTPSETNRNSQNGRPYLLDLFMNRQVAWDSEYYLSLGTVGYEDPDIQTAKMPTGENLSKNYAFFPFYPVMIGVVRTPLQVLGLTPIATSTLAGVVVAGLGTLGGMFALYHLTGPELGEAGALRAVFYLLIFPTGFFLAQVYTEGLFIGLAFGALAFMQRKNLLLAAALAFLATWTRAVGIALILPLALAWLAEINWNTRKLTTARILKGILALSPLAAYILWHLALGERFALIEENFFGRGLFAFKRFSDGMTFAFDSIIKGENLQMRAYFMLEFGGVLLAAIASLFTLRRYPGIALFSLTALVVALTSGAPQSLIRYVLVLPSLYIFLGRLGRNIVFDRAWTLVSLLLMGLLMTLFTFDMWVA